MKLLIALIVVIIGLFFALGQAGKKNFTSS